MDNTQEVQEVQVQEVQVQEVQEVQVQVVFRDVAQVFYPQSPVEVHYSLTAEHSWSGRDWIGLFQVGWTSMKDYHTYVWASAPQGPLRDHSEGTQSAPQGPPRDHSEGTQVNGCALFTAFYLPSPALTQYQFVYVAEDGEVRGQSGSFTFSAPKPLVELQEIQEIQETLKETLKEEQEGEEMSRATLLQTQLSECQRLVSEVQRALDVERQEVDLQKESGRRARGAWEEERGAMKEVISELRQNLRLSLEQLRRSEGRHQDVQFTRENMSSELSFLWTEKSVNQQKISDLEETIRTLSDREEETDRETDRMKERERKTSSQLKHDEEKRKALQVEMEGSQAEVRELRERLTSGEHVTEVLRKELYEAGLQRDHTHSELHKARLHKAQLTLQMSDENLGFYEARAAWALEKEALRQAAEMDLNKVQQLSAELQQKEAWLQEERAERKEEAELTRERDDDYRVQLSYGRQEVQELKSSLERVQKESEQQQQENKDLRGYIHQLEKKVEVVEEEEEEEEETYTDSFDDVKEAEQKKKEAGPVIVLTLSSHREVDTPLEFMTDALDEWRCSESTCYGPPPRPEPALSDNDIYMW